MKSAFSGRFFYFKAMLNFIYYAPDKNAEIHFLLLRSVYAVQRPGTVHVCALRNAVHPKKR
jgi:hypothetical protein